jgi:hypothetical protein
MKLSIFKSIKKKSRNLCFYRKKLYFIKLNLIPEGLKKEFDLKYRTLLYATTFSLFTSGNETLLTEEFTTNM